MDEIRPFYQTPLIKVITGIRRSGKSCLLQQIQEDLRSAYPRLKPLYIDMELLQFSEFRKPNIFADFLGKQRRSAQGRRPIFIDEVQDIPEWERCVNSLLKEKCWDIYITGSNAHLLSSEIATLIAGRYVEFPVFTLSYGEYLEIRGTQDSQEEFQLYLKFGGFPGIHELPDLERTRLQYLASIHDTILLRDVVERNAIRDPKTLESVVNFVYDNIGSYITAKSMSDYLKSQHVGISVVTLQSYLKALESGYAIYEAKRYDIKGKRHLDIYSKYFIADLGLRHTRIGFRDRDIAGQLENLVYLHLRRMHYQVSIGRLGEHEVDFVAEKEGQIVYVQVATSIQDAKTREREYRSLEQIPDNYPKYVVSLDSHRSHAGGIRHIPLRAFLLGEL